MTTKDFFLSIFILAIIYAWVTVRSNENIYPVTYSESQIQVAPYAGDVPTPPMPVESGENTYWVE